MNRKIYNKVLNFNTTFGVEIPEELIARLPNNTGILNYNLMEEENSEYLDAVIKDDIVEVYDALVDQLVVLMGNFQKHGFTYEHIEDGISEVNASNMSKLNEDGTVKRREDGKILKGENYFRPDLKQFINNGD